MSCRLPPSGCGERSAPAQSPDRASATSPAWVANRDVSTEAYAALLRAITRAVRRINADKRRYVSYFIRDWSSHPEVAALGPENEARWAWEWMASWGLIEGAFDVTTQINRKVEREAHELATAVRAG